MENKRCGLCNKKIFFWEKVVQLVFNGKVHQKCAEKFIKNGILFKLKGMAIENERIKI